MVNAAWSQHSSSRRSFVGTPPRHHSPEPAMAAGTPRRQRPQPPHRSAVTAALQVRRAGARPAAGGSPARGQSGQRARHGGSHVARVLAGHPPETQHDPRATSSRGGHAGPPQLEPCRCLRRCRGAPPVSAAAATECPVTPCRLSLWQCLKPGSLRAGRAGRAGKQGRALCGRP